jgi:hypothetical protein
LFGFGPFSAQARSLHVRSDPRSLQNRATTGAANETMARTPVSWRIHRAITPIKNGPDPIVAVHELGNF